MCARQMNVKISEKKALKIFARCDKGGSGTLTYAEYLAAYEILIMGLAKDALSNMGFTPRKIVAGVLSAAAGLGTLFAFIFLGINSFGGSGNFGSSIRSSMSALSAVGASSVSGKSKSVSEDDAMESIDDAIKVALDE